MKKSTFTARLLLSMLYGAFIISNLSVVNGQSEPPDFQLPAANEAGTQYPDDMAIVDLNSDGHLDVVILGTNRAHFLVGDGTGALEKDKSFATGVATDIAIADFNNDGVMDLATSNLYSNTLPSGTCGTAIHLGVGGSFAPSFVLKRCLANIWGPLAIVDFNQDGILDVVGKGTAQSARLGYGIALGIGDGTFIDSQRIDLNDAPSELAQEINDQWSDLYSTGDLNADGFTDQVTVNNANDHSLVVTLANNPTTIFNLYALADTPRSVAIADMNNDGHLDVVVRIVNSSELLIYPGDGSGQLLEPVNISAVNTSSRLRANDILIADFDENGWRDFALADWFLEEDSNLWGVLQIAGNTVDTTAPTIAISTPTEASSVSNTIAVTALANDDMGITRVDFFQDNTLISSSAGPVYTASWDTLGVADGDYIITATAFDAAGNNSDSSVTVEVDNSAPTITSLPTLHTKAIVGRPYTYHAVATGILPLGYDLIVSPAGMTIDANGIIDWIPTKEQLGAQTITLEAFNDYGSDRQTFTINVIDATAPSTPTGLGVIEFIDDNTVTIGWEEATDDVEVVGYRLYRYYYSNRWNKGYRAVGDVIGTTADVARYIYIYAHRQQSVARYQISAFDAAGNVSPRSAVILVQGNTVPNIYHNNRSSGEGVSYYNLDGTAFYGATVGQLFRHSISATGVPKPTRELIDAPSGMAINGNWLEWRPQPGQEGAGNATVRANNSEGFAEYTVNFHAYPSQVENNLPVASATATPFSITLPENTVSLSGTASDDGLPNNTLTYNWSINGSAPGPVVFGNATAANTTVSVTTAGSYFFKLTVSDGELSTETHASFSVIEVPVNTAPFIGGIADRQITWPLDHVNLSTYVSKESLNFAWTKVSGPGVITFSNGSGLFSPGYVLGLPRLGTEAYFSTSGLYVIQLTITDLGGLSTTTTVQVTVNPPAPTNTAPQVNAGADQTLTFPEQTIALSGSAVDDGLPSVPGTLSFQWSLVSGLESVSFSSSTKASSNVTFFEEGRYVLRLTASDGVLSHADELTVTVLPVTDTPTLPPEVDPNAETAEIEGQVSEVGIDFIVVNGQKIWFSNNTILKFGDGTNGEFAIGQSAQLKAQPNLDGSLTGIKIEVGD